MADEAGNQAQPQGRAGGGVAMPGEGRGGVWERVKL